MLHPCSDGIGRLLGSASFPVWSFVALLFPYQFPIPFFLSFRATLADVCIVLRGWIRNDKSTASCRWAESICRLPLHLLALCVCVSAAALPHELLIKALLAQSITVPPASSCLQPRTADKFSPTELNYYFLFCVRLPPPHDLSRLERPWGAGGRLPQRYTATLIRSVHANLPLSAGILSIAA